MNKKQQLYVKLPNGRYKPYEEPRPEYDNMLYRKRGKRYVPWGMDLKYNELDEGVWVITKGRGCKSYASGKMLYESYLCIKCGDIIEAPALAELGGYEKLATYLLQHWGEVDKTCVDTMCKTIIGVLMKYQKEEEK